MAKVHGNKGLILDAAGELSVDRMGVWSGACRFKIPIGRFDLVPLLNSMHPHANFCLAERQRVNFTPGLWTVYIDYAGANVEETEPVYELSPGTGNEPIETHDKFVSTLAGTASSPKNGAVFVNGDGEKTTDNELGVFDRFSHTVSGGAFNPFSGVKEYITANNTVWTKSWTRKNAPSAGTRIIKIAEPDGPNPSYGGKYNWLEMPTSYVKRGGAYACETRWLLSGRAGWNTEIYS